MVNIELKIIQLFKNSINYSINQRLTKSITRTTSILGLDVGADDGPEDNSRDCCEEQGSDEQRCDDCWEVFPKSLII